MWSSIVPVVSTASLIGLTYVSMHKWKKYKTNQRKKLSGDKGEALVNQVLANLSDDYVYKDDAYIPKNGKKGEFTQIDHLVVSRYGIFVIETKNHGGTVSAKGAKQSTHWVHTNRKGHVSEFYSPCLQNDTHIYQLKSFLNLDESYFIPIVVFSGNVELQHMPNDMEVIYVNELKNTILGHTKVLLTEKECAKIIHKIQGIKITNKNKREHVKSIQKTYKSKKKCPLCGNALAIRDGKYGPFWGCSNFPKCNYTKPKGK